MNGVRRRFLACSAATLGLPALSARAQWLPGSAAAPRAVDEPDIAGLGVDLPRQLRADGSGPMSALLRGIAERYTEGQMRFAVLPRNRVMQALRDGSTDFGFPLLQAPAATATVDPAGFRYGRFPVGRVSFVIYSRRSSPLTRADLDAAAKNPLAPAFPWRIAALPVFDWGFPTERMLDPGVTDWQRLAAGRIDAIVYGQDGGDQLLRQSGATGLQRAHFGDLHDVLGFPLGARGEFVEAALERTLKRMQREGLLAPLQAQVHRPWNPWQP